MTNMNRAVQPRWIVFALAIPVSVYVSFLGTIFMGSCPGLECWPHTFAWTLLAPCLLLAIWSLRAPAIAGVVLLLAHLYTEAHIYGEGLSAAIPWDTDKGLDLWLWIAVLLLIAAALIPKKVNHRQ